MEEPPLVVILAISLKWPLLCPLVILRRLSSLMTFERFPEDRVLLEFRFSAPRFFVDEFLKRELL
jgi:hypothetical protein